MTAFERQEHITALINGLGDCFDQYNYLIASSAELAPMPEDYKTPENLVRGCQSVVWVKAFDENGTLRFFADSDTLIIKGILRLLAEICDGSDVAEIRSLDINFLDRTQLGEVFESERLTGIRAIISKIKET